MLPSILARQRQIRPMIEGLSDQVKLCVWLFLSNPKRLELMEKKLKKGDILTGISAQSRKEEDR